MIRLAAVLVCCAAPLAAAPLDASRVQALVEHALRAAGQEGQVMISQYRTFPPCPKPPTVTPLGGDWQSVRLSCGDTGWQRTLRVRGGRPAPRSARDPDARPADLVIVLRESLPRGTVIEAAHLDLAERPAGHRDGLVVRKATAIGRRLRTNLGAGQALLGRHLDHDWTVTEGAPVTITNATAGVRIEAAGVALENGQMGQEIEVANARSGDALQGVVTGPNKVKVLPNMR